MTVPLSNQGPQTNAGLAQDRATTGFGLESGLARDDGKPGTRGEDEFRSAAFAMQLAGARAAAAAKSDDDTETSVVAVAVPPPVVFGVPDDAGADPEVRRADLAAVAQRLVDEIASTDRIRLGGNGPVALTVPLNATALGLAEARLQVTKGEVTVVFPLRAGADPAVVAAALGDLAQVLAQRFPQRTIRLRKEDGGDAASDPAEFNPLKEPVGRRK